MQPVPGHAIRGQLIVSCPGARLEDPDPCRRCRRRPCSSTSASHVDCLGLMCSSAKTRPRQGLRSSQTSAVLCLVLSRRLVYRVPSMSSSNAIWMDRARQQDIDVFVVGRREDAWACRAWTVQRCLHQVLSVHIQLKSRTPYGYG